MYQDKILSCYNRDALRLPPDYEYCKRQNDKADRIKLRILLVVLWLAAIVLISRGCEIAEKVAVTPKVEAQGLQVTRIKLVTISLPDKPYQVKNGVLTAYNTFSAQTDSSPCISASGVNICGLDNIIANNCHPFSTLVEIDGKTYEVQDRLNSRYGCERWDISFDKDLQGAREFGKRQLAVKVYE